MKVRPHQGAELKADRAVESHNKLMFGATTRFNLRGRDRRLKAGFHRLTWSHP
jgi:hypothetical protein